MGTITSYLGFGMIQKSVVMLGINDAGKTALLHKLILSKTVKTIPTNGFHYERIEHKGVIFAVWDVHTVAKTQSLWCHYYHNTDAIVYVIDCNDRETISESVEELQKLLSCEELENAVFLILANKQDLPNAMEPSALAEMLKFRNPIKRPWLVVGTSATSGSGLKEAFDWLSGQITK